MEPDELHEESSCWVVKIYLGPEKIKANQIVDESGSEEDMWNLYSLIANGAHLQDELLSQVAMGHLDLDPGWEKEEYYIELLDNEANEECCAVVRME
ncbi:MAG: hypothetical protein KBC72_00405 [Acinetobacter sp.]|nr:hypothetical protein [Acinetobacter sp.]